MSATRIERADLLALRAQAAAVDLSSRRRVLTDLGGTHLSGFRGRGMEFEEHRPYAPGDEVRTIDWRVTARTGTPHVRLYREERERPVILAVDLRPAMWFGTRNCFKAVLAARAAALLAWAAVERGDRVGGLSFADGVHRERRPGGGRRSVMQFLHLLESTPRPQTPATGDLLGDALKRLIRAARPGSIVAVISDFRGLDEAGTRLLGQLARRVELIAGFVHDPLERALPPPAQYPVQSGASVRLIDTAPAAARRQWAARFEARRAALATVLRRAGAHDLDLPTERPLEESFRIGLGRRRLTS